MSRTKKDIPPEIRFHDWQEGYKENSRFKVAGFWPKTKKEIDNIWHWCGTTPGWWCKLFMNRPLRRKARIWERKVETSKINNLEELDIPNNSKKPHKYYY